MKPTREKILADVYASYLSHETVAREAYAIWEYEGRPDGSQKHPKFPGTVAQYHWWWAQVKLDMIAETDADFIWWVWQLAEGER
jgi:hypothetical protein